MAIIDSGVHASHPHVGSVRGGVAIDRDGSVSGDFVDRIGHGTAVTAAIREKAPDAELFAVRIFDGALTTSATTVIAAIDWAVEAGMHVINLSLGTSNAAHRQAFIGAVARAEARGAVIVAARDDEGVDWLPGILPGVVPVQVDWDCPRDHYSVATVGGTHVFRASGFARPIPGVDPRRNLHGVSFAVAHMSAFVACALESLRPASTRDVLQALATTN